MSTLKIIISQIMGETKVVEKPEVSSTIISQIIGLVEVNDGSRPVTDSHRFTADLAEIIEGLNSGPKVYDYEPPYL